MKKNVLHRENQNPEYVIISDVHLGTRASKASELVTYLKSIKPKKLILNGDIIDAWRFSRNYFPKSHLKVIRQMIKMMEKGVEIIYVTGNHDEFLRKFEGTKVGKLQIVNQYMLELNGDKTWIFHGDVFDSIIHNAKWLAKIGAQMYGFLTLINDGVNYLLNLFNKKPIILYKLMKKPFINSKVAASSKFEDFIAQIGYDREVDNIICSHTHIPLDKMLKHKDREIRYINSGDWVENITAIEFYENNWHLEYYEDKIRAFKEMDKEDLPILNQKDIYHSIFQELLISN